MFKWIASVLDSQQSPSFGRTGSAFVTFMLLAWGSWVTYHTGAIPALPVEWAGFAVTFYLGTAGKEAYVKSKENLSGPLPPGN